MAVLYGLLLSLLAPYFTIYFVHYSHHFSFGISGPFHISPSIVYTGFSHMLALVLLFTYLLGGSYMEVASSYVGYDGLSLPLIWLVTFLAPYTLLSLGRFRLLSLVIFWTTMAFVALTLVLFYVSFEGVLVPLMVLVGWYGGRTRKVSASRLLVLYTVLGSLFLFYLMAYMPSGLGNLSIYADLSGLTSLKQFVCWMAFFLSFSIKVPMLPFHGWLLEAHVEAPTSVSVVLAAVLLKLGSYGFIRFNLAMLPLVSLYFSNFIYVVGTVGCLYACLAAISQMDLKKVVAYSSVAHMNFSVVGLFSFNFTSVLYSMFFMISHGLISAGLFFMVGAIYDRFHTRNLKYFSSALSLPVAKVMPMLIALFMLFTLANIGLPSTSAFLAEYFVLAGLFTSNLLVVGLVLGLALLFTPVYLMTPLHKLAYGSGPSRSNYSKWIASDLSFKELATLLPLLVLVFVLGICPHILLALFEGVSGQVMGVTPDILIGVVVSGRWCKGIVYRYPCVDLWLAIPKVIDLKGMPLATFQQLPLYRQLEYYQTAVLPPRIAEYCRQLGFAELVAKYRQLMSGR